VRVALHGEWAILEVGHERRPDLPVVLEEVALRDAVLGVENALRRAQVDGLRGGDGPCTDIRPAPLDSDGKKVQDDLVV
jgi:hypothetical protein